MKRELLLLILSILLFESVLAQGMEIEDYSIKDQGDSIAVTLWFTVDKVRSNERLTVRPILYNGGDSLDIHWIAVTGRNRDISDKRNGKYLEPQVRTNTRKKVKDLVKYVSITPYKDWMSQVSLGIESKVESCCVERSLTWSPVVSDKLIRYDVIMPFIEHLPVEQTALAQLDSESAFLSPLADYENFKDNFDALRTEGALIVRFDKGSASIDSGLGDNAESLERVCRVFELIEQDPGASIGKIVLAGTASPEGSSEFNNRLAEQRSRALQQYLGSKTEVDLTDVIENVNVGEDWAGLRRIVAQSDMQYKSEVLHIIDNVPVSGGREKQLMDLKWGRPYNYMMEHFFPLLRSAGYIRVFYESRPSEDFKATNLAVDLYNQREYRKALEMLAGVKSSAAVENIRGVCNMMLGKYEMAAYYLNIAIRMGNSQAAQSLDQLHKLGMIET